MLCSNQGKKQIIAQFDGGEITSDGGLLLLREAALGMNLFHRLARCFWDCRDERYLQYPLDEMPDRLAEDFIMFMRQNQWGLPKRRRIKEFEALTDAEVSTLENIVRDAFDGFENA